jgi:hypothetical protein
LSTVARAERARALTFPFTHHAGPGCPVPARRARALSTCGAPTPQLPKLRNAFLPKILSTSLLAGARSEPSRQRSVPGLGHPGLTFDTLSHTSLCARHTVLRLFIEARRATCRLWDSATETIFEHTHKHSKPPHPAASCHPSSDSAPCEAPPAELTQPRGCVAPTLHNHHPRDRSRRGSTPTCFGSDTSCRELMRDGSWKKDPPCDRAVAASVESARLGSPCLRVASL